MAADSETIVIALENAVWQAIESGWTPEQVRAEVEFCIDDAKDSA